MMRPSSISLRRPARQILFSSASTIRAAAPVPTAATHRSLSTSTSTGSGCTCANGSRRPQVKQTQKLQQQQQQRQHRNAYHSYDHPSSSAAFTPVEESILSAAYQHVPSHGFTPSALAAGARDAGYLDISPTILPEGAFALIRYHLVKQREELAARVSELFGGEGHVGARPGLSEWEIRGRVEAVTWERLSANAQVIGRWQEALAIMAQPSYVPLSLKELALLSDEILFLAGDSSVDPSWYTKRASLSTIYAAAELFMTNDHSPEFMDTRAFLNRRLREVNEVGGVFRNLREWVGFTATAGVNVLRSKGVKI
ncbi:COQ9-domain-containing protein [Neurospora hispaniola]|uniref:Ubiquinone biosynthesis protein n=1 Tax=Neurospora hispaniola TaxID=588809 RepID=A0AAJ0I0I8_9PEZI|nr:COQ9-domain-containing protein [Neurospora hispaniola]